MYALGAGSLFNVNGHSEYVETTIGKHFKVLSFLFINLISLFVVYR